MIGRRSSGQEMIWLDQAGFDGCYGHGSRAVYPFSLWEKARMRGYNQERFLSPLPDPLPEGEGA
jgi:hypothetical protein